MVIMVRHFFQRWVLTSKVSCFDGNWSMGWCVTQDSGRQAGPEGMVWHKGSFREWTLYSHKRTTQRFLAAVELEEPVGTGDWWCWEVGIPFIGQGLELSEQCLTPVCEVLSSISSTEKQNIKNKILEGPGTWRTRAPGKGWPKCSLHGQVLPLCPAQQTLLQKLRPSSLNHRLLHLAIPHIRAYSQMKSVSIRLFYTVFARYLYWRY